MNSENRDLTPGPSPIRLAALPRRRSGRERGTAAAAANFQFLIPNPYRIARLLLLLAGLALPVLAQETVTIPKARLEELERKEAELKRLKAELARAKGENVGLTQPHAAEVGNIASPPVAAQVVARVSPALASLPPLKDGELVEAVDLASHYRSDPAAADLRYRKHKFRVQGEVAGFEKPLFIRNYKIILKTLDGEMKLICDLQPPEKFSAVFTVNHGSQLVGLMRGETRVPIAKVGDTVVVAGQCTGLRDLVVALSGCELQSVR